MLCTGLVLLSENDPEAPQLTAVATVSKDDDFDDGCFDIGADAASRGVLWVDRPYFVGNPEVSVFVERANRVTEQGGYCQIGNEQNLTDVEHWLGGPEAWFAFEDAVRSAVARPDRMLSMPPSPGMPDWHAWVRPEGDHACHAYGDRAGMQAIIQWYLDNTAGDVWITEMNPGAGNTFDLAAWAYAELDPFLAWCASQPRVKMAAFFAWKWDQSGSLPSSVNACDCPAVVEVLSVPRVPPMNGGAPEADIILSAPTTVAWAHPANYDPGPRARTVGVVIHTTRGGANSPEDEYYGTVGWFQNPQAGVSTHLVVGPGEVARCLHDDAVGWHCRTANDDHLGIEVCQARDGDPISDFQYQATAEACRLWAERYGFPLARVMGEAAPGLVGHEDTASGQQDGKTDPGYAWDWPRFVWYCTEGTEMPTYDIDGARDRVWAIADELEQHGWPWYGQSLKAATSLSKKEQ